MAISESHFNQQIQMLWNLPCFGSLKKTKQKISTIYPITPQHLHPQPPWLPHFAFLGPETATTRSEVPTTSTKHPTLWGKNHLKSQEDYVFQNGKSQVFEACDQSEIQKLTMANQLKNLFERRVKTTSQAGYAGCPSFTFLPKSIWFYAFSCVMLVTRLFAPTLWEQQLGASQEEALVIRV